MDNTPRGSGFLLSRNRRNVAVSRALGGKSTKYSMEPLSARDGDPFDGTCPLKLRIIAGRGELQLMQSKVRISLNDPGHRSR